MATPATAPKEKVFDERGREIPESEADNVEDVEVENDEGEEEEEDEELENGETDDEGLEDEDEESDEEAESEEPEAKAEGAGEKKKYRVGDKTFATMAEALAYAESESASKPNDVDAFRQGIETAARILKQPGNADPAAADDFNEDEYYANPREALKKHGEKVKTEVIQTLQQQQSQVTQAEAAWAVFTARHPDLADFREEIEAFAGQNKAQLAGITNAKGFDATCDYMAMKVRAKFDKYLETLKPRKTLANARGNTTPSGKGTSVTPKKKQEPVLSFSAQIRSLKQGKR